MGASGPGSGHGLGCTHPGPRAWCSPRPPPPLGLGSSSSWSSPQARPSRRPRTPAATGSRTAHTRWVRPPAPSPGRNLRPSPQCCPRAGAGGGGTVVPVCTHWRLARTSDSRACSVCQPPAASPRPRPLRFTSSPLYRQVARSPRSPAIDSPVIFVPPNGLLLAGLR